MRTIKTLYQMKLSAEYALLVPVTFSIPKETLEAYQSYTALLNAHTSILTKLTEGLGVSGHALRDAYTRCRHCVWRLPFSTPQNASFARGGLHASHCAYFHSRACPHLQSSNSFDQPVRITNAVSITTQTVPNLPQLLTGGGVPFTIDPCRSAFQGRFQTMVTEVGGCPRLLIRDKFPRGVHD